GNAIALNDSGTGGDPTAGDSNWSFDFAIPAGATAGTFNLPFTVTDTSSNIVSGTVALTVTDPTGACCNNGTGSCSVVTGTACTTGSSYQGDGTACPAGGAPCPGTG